MSLHAWRFRLRLLAATLSAIVGSGSRDAVLAQDDRAWSAARSANTIEAYEEYLSANPTGPFAAEAFSAIVAISRGLAADGGGRTAEPAVGTRGFGAVGGAGAGAVATGGFAEAIY